MARSTILTAIIFINILSVFGQPKKQISSYNKALKIVLDSYNSMGGQAALDSVDDIEYNLSGEITAKFQSFTSSPPYAKFPVKTRIFYSLKDTSILFEQENGTSDGTTFANRVFANSKGGYNLIYNRGSFADVSSNSSFLDIACHQIPVLILQRVLQKKASLRYQEEALVNGKRQHLIYASLDNQIISAYFDVKTKFLTRYDFLEFDALNGDHQVSYCFNGYRSFNKLFLPTYFSELEGDNLIQVDTCTTFKFNQKLDSSVFTLPIGYPAYRRPPLNIKNLAKDIFLVEGLAAGVYRCLVVNLSDGLLVVDAPINSNVTANLINEIKKKIPNRPIKYIVPTHHHGDHIGGIRPFIAEGAKIITTNANKRIFAQIANAEYTLNPDILSNEKANIDFMIVEDSLNLIYANGEIEIRKLKFNSHAKDIYVIYIPKEKTVFHADLYTPTKNGVSKSTVEFYKEVSSLGWQVETIIGCHEGSMPFSKFANEVVKTKEQN